MGWKMRFYIITSDRAFPLAEWSEKMSYRTTIRCVSNPGHQRAGDRQDILRINVLSTKYIDVIWTWYSELLFSEKIVEMFRKENITGYVVSTVVVDNVFSSAERQNLLLINKKPCVVSEKYDNNNQNIIEKLSEIKIIGKGGFADKHTGILLLEQCNECGYKKYTPFRNGIFIDEKQWDGSDMFRVEPFGYAVVSERFKMVVEKNKILNICFRETKDIIHPSRRNIGKNT